MTLGLSCFTLNFVVSVLVLWVWGDTWLDWAYQTTLSVLLSTGYLILLFGLQRFTEDINRWRSIPLLLFGFYPWWVLVRELLRMS